MTMAVTTEVREAVSGYQYRIYTGCNVVEDSVAKGTADNITGGFEFTESAAQNAVTEFFEENE